MFKFFKDKLKDVLSGISKKVEKEEPEQVEKIEEELKQEAKEEKIEEKKEKTKKEQQPKEKKKVPRQIKEKDLEPTEKEIRAEKAAEKKELVLESEKTEIIEEKKPEPKEEKGFFGKLKEQFIGKTEEKVEEKTHKKEETAEIKEEEPKGIIAQVKHQLTTKKISKEQFNELFWELEVIMLENNVAMEVIDKVKKDLEATLVEKSLPRGKVEQSIREALKKSMGELFISKPPRLEEMAGEKKPFIVLFVGINGSGKTTTIAKVASMMAKQHMKVVLAAADTFRAASIEQLQIHADKIGIKLIKHDYGSDPAAVAFDAIKFAQAKNYDVVLIDTAGRLHSNTNLMDEMKKIVRVAKPDVKIFIGESITGNDCVEQARSFDEAVGIDGIILSKADVDEKGGAAISVSYVTKKPILYIGTGQEYSDLKRFDSEEIMKGLGLS